METVRFLKKMKEYQFDPSISQMNIFSLSEYKTIYEKMKKEYLHISLEWDQLSYQVEVLSKDHFLKLKKAYFLSKDIYQYIIKHFIYVWKIQNPQGNIQLIWYSSHKTPKKNEKDEILKMMKCIELFQRIFGRSGRFQKVEYYPTPLKKKIPNSGDCKHCHLGQNECNSGMTLVNYNENPEDMENGDILIFREEEHMKVLIHEMIHSNFRDIMLIRHSDNVGFTNQFCTDYEILLNESYTEFHATILNIFWIGIYHGMKKKEIEDLLKKEIEYGIYVFHRILKHYGIDDVREILKVDDFCRKHLKQKTNVIAYYIFKPLQMFHMKEMNEYVKKESENLQIVSRDGVERYRQNMMGWIREDDFHERVKMRKSGMRRDGEKSLRMTLFEL